MSQLLTDILDKLGDYTPINDATEYMAVCPCHDDNKASLWIAELDTGDIAVKCHAGCKNKDIKKFLGIPNGATPKNISYPYTDMRGKTVFTKIRTPDKKFSVEGDYDKDLLYNLHNVIASDTVYVVEGEKDAEALITKGLCATTCPSGSTGFTRKAAEYLSGRRIIVIPDNDIAGTKYANTVVSYCKDICDTIIVVDIPTLYSKIGKLAEPKADISDWLVDGGDIKTLTSHIKTCLMSQEGYYDDELEWKCLRAYAQDSTLPVSMEHLMGDVTREIYSILTSHASCDADFVNYKLKQKGINTRKQLISSIFKPLDNSAEYVAELIELTNKRKLKRTLQECIEDLSTTSSEACISKILGTSLGRVDNKVSTQKLVTDTLKELESLVIDNNGYSGLPTGIKRLDDITCGLQKSDLLVIAARPGVGKTALATTILSNIAVDNNRPVMLFSLEMSSNQVITRLISMLSGIGMQSLRKREYDESVINEVASKLAKSSIVIDDTASIDIDKLVKQCISAVSNDGVQLVVIDYIQLITSSNKKERRDLELAYISSRLKYLAKTCNIPVIALAQLNRAVEGRKNSQPFISDIRESGAIEQDADIIMLLDRDTIDGDTHSASLYVAKHRNGPTGKIALRFDPERALFYSPKSEVLQAASVSEEVDDFI